MSYPLSLSCLLGALRNGPYLRGAALEAGVGVPVSGDGLGRRGLHQGLHVPVLEGIGGGAEDVRLLGSIGAAALADGGAVAVEGALAEAKVALLVLELVAGEAELGVLDADVGTAVVHLVHVLGVVVKELGKLVKELVEGEGVAAAGAEGPGEHGDGPLAEAEGLLAGALVVEEADEVEADVPVAAEVEVLDGVHGDVLQNGQADDGGEEVELDEVPVQDPPAVEDLGRVGGLGRDSGGGDHLLDDGAERVALVQPQDEELHHLGALLGQPQDLVVGGPMAGEVGEVAVHGARRAGGRGGGGLEAVAEEGAGGAQQLLVDGELPPVRADQQTNHLGARQTVASCGVSRCGRGRTAGGVRAGCEERRGEEMACTYDPKDAMLSDDRKGRVQVSGDPLSQREQRDRRSEPPVAMASEEGGESEPICRPP